jgi:hypothetical protein
LTIDLQFVKNPASRVPASQATSSRIAGRHHLGISGRLRRNLHLNVFWTILGGKALLFFAVFAGSAILLWLNETLAYRFARRRGHVRRVDFEQMASGVETLPELLVPVAHQLYHRRQSDHVPSHHSGPGTETIAPFLRLDRDPYLVISEGRQDWQPLMDTYGRRRRSRQISRSCVGSWSR